MVAVCPKCGARYRVEADRIGPDAAKLRCTQCSAVFLVRAPREVEPVSAVAPEPLAAESSTPSIESSRPSAPPLKVSPTALAAPGPKVEIDRERLVLIADPDAARGKASAAAVEGWGLQSHLVDDGVEAMLAIQRLLPRVVVLDAALPRMIGAQVCEVVKRNESLRDTVVVLVDAIEPQSRERRDPADLYEADVSLEQPDLPDGLLAILREEGLPMQEDHGSPVTPAPVAEDDPEKAEERERAQRLARIAVSEMLLYQPERFEQAVHEGNLEQILDLEIREARALLRQRIREDVREETDFIMDELNRVAAERSGRGGPAV